MNLQASSARRLLEIECAVTAMQSVAPNRECIYLSCPITGGPLTLSEDKHDLDIISENIKNGLGFTRYLRSIFKDIVICPASVCFIPSWTQDDYLIFWEKVIRSMVNRIFFAPGWQYSKGCCYEYYIGYINNKQLYNTNMQHIQITDALSDMQLAIEDMNKNLVDVTFYQKIYDLLREIYLNDAGYF
jgi:hypothetical protein